MSLFLLRLLPLRRQKRGQERKSGNEATDKHTASMFSAANLTRLTRASMASSARGGIIRPSLHMRNIITVRATPVEEESILVAQRKNRPVSPHLEIYEKQLTAVLSALHRITGVGLAAGFLVVTSSYAVGLVDTASLVTFFAGLPVAAKVAFKAVAGVPFAFHAWNGVRHMVWDSGHEANIKGVYKTGYAVLGLTAVSALALLFA